MASDLQYFLESVRQSVSKLGDGDGDERPAETTGRWEGYYNC